MIGTRKEDLVIIKLGLACFEEGLFKLTFVSGKDKPIFARGSSACYSIAEKKTDKVVGYFAMYNKAEIIKEFDVNGNIKNSKTYDDCLNN